MYWYNEIVFYTLSERYVCDWIELLHSQHCTRYSEQYNQYRGDRAQSLKDTKSGHCDIQYSHYDICDCHNDCFRTLKAVTVVLSLVITLPGTKEIVKVSHVSGQEDTCASMYGTFSCIWSPDKKTWITKALLCVYCRLRTSLLKWRWSFPSETTIIIWYVSDFYLTLSSEQSRLPSSL